MGCMSKRPQSSLCISCLKTVWLHNSVCLPLFKYWIIMCADTELVINHCCTCSEEIGVDLNNDLQAVVLH